jgi:hypothetical protein
MQTIWGAISFHIQLPISGLNLHVKTHFHTFDILHWKQITLSQAFVTFKMENSGRNIFEPRNIFQH